MGASWGLGLRTFVLGGGGELDRRRVFKQEKGRDEERMEQEDLQVRYSHAEERMVTLGWALGGRQEEDASCPRGGWQVPGWAGATLGQQRVRWTEKGGPAGGSW